MLTFARMRQFFRAAEQARATGAGAVPAPVAASPMRQTFFDLTAGVAAAASRRDWDAAIDLARQAGAMAERLGDPDLLYEAAKSLQRLEVFDRAWELFCVGHRIRWLAGKPEWDGGELSGRTLLIRSTDYQPGDLLRFARLIGHASRRAGARRCIVLTEDKLVGLLRRNFPAVEFGVEGRDHEAALAAADTVTTLEALCRLFANDWSAILRSFVRLVADPTLTAQFRQRYRGDPERPVIGIAWWSGNAVKDVPSIEDWANLMRRVPGTFVSLQYGEAAAAVVHFTAALGDRFVVDATVDPAGERDRFAAQVAALDAVVTIPQTCAHLAGALDVPTVVLLDDRFHLSWPQIGSATPWYPNMTVVRKRDRTWGDTLDAGAGHLARVLADRPR
jgi:hypothetical protein